MNDATRFRNRVRNAALLVLGVAAAACGSQTALGDATDGGAPEQAAGTTYTVQIDGTADGFAASFHDFFPNRLSVHPGDTIVFPRPDNGEMHTVTASDDPPTRPGGPGSAFFVGGFGGPPRASTSMPCVLAEGSPLEEGCTPDQQALVPFDGTQSWFNSGGLVEDDEFVLELSQDIEPGSYLFVCLIHTPFMQVKVDVVAPSQAVPGPAEVIARGQEQLDQQRARAQRLIDEPLRENEGQVVAARANATFTAWANTFAPEEIEIAVGDTVSWWVRGVHTVSFNAPESARPFYERADDGSIRENEIAAQPQGEVTAWDGSGMLNSGLLTGLFPPERFDVTFTQPGTYAYRCLVHFDMEGKVKVSG